MAAVTGIEPSSGSSRHCAISTQIRGKMRIIYRVRNRFRAIGPSLANFNVSGPLLDPQLDIHDAQGALIGHNDNWKQEPDGTPNPGREAAINATGLAPTNDAEAAILFTPAPGNYTAVVSGVGGTTGVGLVEAYRLAVRRRNLPFRCLASWIVSPSYADHDLPTANLFPKFGSLCMGKIHGVYGLCTGGGTGKSTKHFAGFK